MDSSPLYDHGAICRLLYVGRGGNEIRFGAIHIDRDGRVRYGEFRHPMNVHLTPELEELVQNKVKTGRYHSASEVVREALLLLEEHDQVTQLRRRIDEGLASLDRGEGIEGEPFMSELIRGVRAKPAKRNGK